MIWSNSVSFSFVDHLFNNGKNHDLIHYTCQPTIIPAENLEDALHIALATINGMDFLLTWNFNHINNAIIKRDIIKVAEKNDYECAVICSPEELGGEPL